MGCFREICQLHLPHPCGLLDLHCGNSVCFPLHITLLSPRQCQSLVPLKHCPKSWWISPRHKLLLVFQVTGIIYLEGIVFSECACQLLSWIINFSRVGIIYYRCDPLGLTHRRYLVSSLSQRLILGGKWSKTDVSVIGYMYVHMCPCIHVSSHVWLCFK